MDEALPFTSVTAYYSYEDAGVVKINNIPFTVTSQEICRFVVPYIRLDPSQTKPSVHIIMEKPTGKTMDCFVELPNRSVAKECVRNFEYSIQRGGNTKIGNRQVYIELSDQAELRKAIFPRSRFVEYNRDNGTPRIMQHNEDPSWTHGFRGYFTLEEIYGVTRFAENPARSPFVLKCNQRVYESMISTLRKFPWPATESYTVAARETLFKTTHKLLNILSQRVFAPANATGPYQREVGLNWTLLHEFTYASIRAPFSLPQKSALLRAASWFGETVLEMTSLATNWPFQMILPRKGIEDDSLQLWLNLFDLGVANYEQYNEPTPYKRYMTVQRNADDYPITQWTEEGLRLSFELGTQVELGLMMLYVNRGRTLWTDEPDLPITRWQVNYFTDLMAIVAQDSIDGFALETSKLTFRVYADAHVSPTTIDSGDQGILLDTTVKGKGDARSESSSMTRLNMQKLNPATAKDFIPGSVKMQLTGEHERIDIHNMVKNIWSDSPARTTRVAHPAIISGTPAFRNHQSLMRSQLRNPFESTLVKTRDADASEGDFRPESESIDPLQHVQPQIDEGSLPESRFDTPGQSYPSQRSSTTQCDSIFSHTNVMRQLSLQNSSRHNSAGNDSATGHTSVSSQHKPSLGIASAQKYPNLTYSDMRQIYNDERGIFNRYNPQSSANEAQAQTRTGSMIIRSNFSDRPATTSKTRAQSHTFGAVGEPVPRSTHIFNGDSADDPDRISAANAMPGSTETARPAQAVQHQHHVLHGMNMAPRRGRLSAGELWMGLSDNKH